MKPLDEMTPEEIRIEIAERKGIEIINPFPSMLTYIDGKTSNGLNHYAPVPNWPEDIAAAWKLWEEIPGESVSKQNGQYCAGWIDKRDSTEFVRLYRCQFGATAPLAICKAWIAWKRSEEE